MRRILCALAIAALAVCGDDVMVDVDARGIDAGTTDANGDGDLGPDASCFANPNPNNHVEIINACTTAEKIYKNPVLPLNLPDGSLRPLP
jgi:hypothetical protein